ncbi:hypothetical protein EPA93_16700 [Ktedonosporobacter rubrisoli]|uniref:Uncharacterized protein n=1 Tax=Ktedonosporobacter rubrisoli TaxID=2509675 RepID=A0A4V0YYV5_KTERU|nr:hypothetical protein [Ktedonosporobacter rubrisoli]QBD77541.1 hypothetical protein EPA93_16700 [Ktedonosporobacter rubrisoli]
MGKAIVWSCLKQEEEHSADERSQGPSAACGNAGFWAHARHLQWRRCSCSHVKEPIVLNRQAEAKPRFVEWKHQARFPRLLLLEEEEALAS